MKPALAIVLVVAAAISTLAWWLLRTPEPQPLAPQANAAVATPAPHASAATSRLSASAVLSIDPRAKRPQSAPARSARSSVYNDYLKAKSYKAIYDRLKATPEGQTPEGWFVLYEILRQCATIPDRDARRPAPRATTVNRDDFLKNIADNDPQREKRIAAFEDIHANKCAGLDGLSLAQADLNKLLADAVNGGDPKARAAAIEQDMWRTRRASGGPTTLSDAQVETLQSVLGSKDPAAMVIAGRLLSNAWQDFAVRIGGTDGQIAEPRALFNAWQVLACDYGYPCDANNDRVLSECAFQGHCDASSLQDFIFFYAASPHDSQLVSQYQQILRNAVETGDWSQVTVIRGTRPPRSPRFAS